MTQVGSTPLDLSLASASALRVIQVVPWFAVNDAIGQHIREIDAIVCGLGIPSSIVALRWEEGLTGQCLALSELVVRPNDVVIYHFSSGSEATAIVESLRCRVIVDYHNITPARFFESWSAELAVETKDGRIELERIVQQTFEWVADSGYNAAEIQTLGRPCAVLPVLIPNDRTVRQVDQSLLALLRPQGSTVGAVWLFVGRLAPNKAQHDVIAAFVEFQRSVDSQSRLILVGAPSSPAYGDRLIEMAASRCVPNSVRFLDALSVSELNACFEAADVFVSMSEHEGFCVPIVEAMLAGLPVVAYDAAAVGEIAGGGAILLQTKTPSHVSAAVRRALFDDDVRSQLAAGRAHRINQITGDVARSMWREFIESMRGVPDDRSVAADALQVARSQVATAARTARHDAHNDPELIDEVRQIMIERNRIADMPTRLDLLKKQIVRLGEFARLDPSRIPLTSRSALGSKAHGLIGKVVARQTNGILNQVNEFTNASTRVISDLAEMLKQSPEVGRDSTKIELDDLRRQLADLDLVVRRLSAQVAQSSPHKPE